MLLKLRSPANSSLVSDSPVQCSQVSRICLISALTVADFVDPELTIGARIDTGAQLGIYTLASILRQEGFLLHVINLDQVFLDFLRQSKSKNDQEQGSIEVSPSDSATPLNSAKAPPYFFSRVLEYLQGIDPTAFDVFGLSSICSSYPLTLRLANELKRLNPKATVVLGGPQASVVDVATLQAFPSIDLVIRGEADDALPAVLKILGSENEQEQLAAMPGITFRQGTKVHRNPNGPVIQDLDRLPIPAYDLDPDLINRGGIHLEIGRGCPFACTFCSTNDFFRRNFRLKSPARMIAEMKQLNSTYKIPYFSLVHDMYTIDHKRVREFCAALEESGNDFKWGCSARTDCVDENLIATMAHAGCTGMFFGIETGSPRLQRVLNKNLDLDEAWDRIDSAARHGVSTAVALITGFPDENRADLRDTVNFFIESLRFDGAEPQLSLLAPLAGTPIYEQHKHELVCDNIFSDMSHQGWRQDPADLDLIRAWPEIFPNFYAVPTKWIERAYFKEVRDFVTYLATWFRWLPVALLHISGDFLDVFDRWQDWLSARKARDPGEDLGMAPYYTHRQFRKDFLQFARDCFAIDESPARAAVEALLAMEGDAQSLSARVTDSPVAEISPLDALDSNGYPRLARNLALKDLDIDYKELLACIRKRGELSGVPIKKVTIVLRPIEERRTQIWQLAPETAALMQWCNGKRTVREIVREFSLQSTGFAGIPPEKVAHFGLRLLHKEGILDITMQPELDTESAPLVSHSPLQLLPVPERSSTQRPWPLMAEG